MALTEEQHAWLVGTLKINVKHAEVETGSGDDPGFKPRARGADYEGEESQVGTWREGRKRADETEEEYAARIASGHFVTRTLDAEERAATRTSIDDRGTLRDADGNALSGRKMYAMDAETGAMAVGDEGYGIRDLDADGNPVGDLQDPVGGDYRTNIALAKQSGGTKRVEATHHSTLAEGKDVAAAGFIETSGGKVDRISNASGHYKPQFEHLLQAVEHLMKTGAMLDTEIVNHKGDSVADDNPKALAVYTKVQTLIKSLDADRKSIAAVLKSLEGEAIDDSDAAALDGKIKTHAARTEIAQKAIEALRKMGIGPKNAMTGKVDMTYASAGATGHAFRASAETETLHAHEFLMGEGADNFLPSQDDADEDSSEGVFAYAATDAYPEGSSGYPEDSTGFQPYATVAPAAAAPEPAKPWRDFSAKEAMLDEFRQHAEDHNLRPEDQGEAGRAAISEGRAPALDADAWNAEIDDLADALADIEAEMAPPSAAPAPPVESVYVDASEAPVEDDFDDDDSDDDDDDPDAPWEDLGYLNSDSDDDDRP